MEAFLSQVSLGRISNLEGIFALRKPWQCGLSPASDENIRYLSPTTSGFPSPRWYVKKAPQSLAHCHASVVWWAATGNNTPCRVPRVNKGPSAGAGCLCRPWWESHEMETFSALLALCVGNSPVTGGFPSQRPVTRSFDVFFDLRRQINCWVNNRKVGDLRLHRAHYDVTLMIDNHGQWVIIKSIW